MRANWRAISAASGVLSAAMILGGCDHDHRKVVVHHEREPDVIVERDRSHAVVIEQDRQPDVVVIHEAPPIARIEKRPHSPGRDYVWVDGYYRHDGRHYVWQAGHYERQRPHMVYVKPHWERVKDGWIFRDGGWR